MFLLSFSTGRNGIREMNTAIRSRNDVPVAMKEDEKFYESAFTGSGCRHDALCRLRTDRSVRRSCVFAQSTAGDERGVTV